MAYKLSNKAADDFARIYEYTFTNFGEIQADSYTDKLEKCLNKLSQSPLLGRAYQQIANVRQYHFKQHVIFYISYNSAIFVVRILHQLMLPSLHLNSNNHF